MLVSSVSTEGVNISDEGRNMRAERKGAHKSRIILHYKATKRDVKRLCGHNAGVTQIPRCLSINSENQVDKNYLQGTAKIRSKTNVLK
jgi:hypothetical protein